MALTTSPKLLKGTLVVYQPPEPLPTITVYPSKSEPLIRSLQGRTSIGSGIGKLI